MKTKKDELKKEFMEHNESEILSLISSMYTFAYFNDLGIDETKVIAFECLFDQIEVIDDEKAFRAIDDAKKHLDMIRNKLFGI